MDYSILLFSSDGHKVLEEKNASVLDVHTLPVGFYMMKFTSGAARCHNIFENMV